MFMGLEIILVVGALAFFAVWATSRAQGSGQQGGTESAEEILRQRFAAGEIDADEYERGLAILRH